MESYRLTSLRGAAGGKGEEEVRGEEEHKLEPLRRKGEWQQVMKLCDQNLGASELVWKDWNKAIYPEWLIFEL